MKATRRIPRSISPRFLPRKTKSLIIETRAVGGVEKHIKISPTNLGDFGTKAGGGRLFLFLKYASSSDRTRQIVWSYSGSLASSGLYSQQFYKMGWAVAMVMLACPSVAERKWKDHKGFGKEEEEEEELRKKKIISSGYFLRYRAFSLY